MKKRQPHEITEKIPDFKRGIMENCIEQEQEYTHFVRKVSWKGKRK